MPISEQQTVHDVLTILNRQPPAVPLAPPLRPRALTEPSLEGPSIECQKGKGDDTENLSEQFERLYAGVAQYKGAIELEVGAYNLETRNVEKLVNLWNSYVAFVQSFPDKIEVPNTPDGRRKAEELRRWFVIIKEATERGYALVTSNLSRDVSIYANHVQQILTARGNFEERPSHSNSLTPIKQAVARAQSFHALVMLYVVVDNDETAALLKKFEENEALAKQVSVFDPIDNLRNEYCTYALPNIPKRSDFIQIGRPWNFSTYPVAIVNSTMKAHTEALVAETGSQITSTYRNPVKQAGLGNPGGPHVYGYAVDLSTNRTKEDFLRVAKAACEHSPSWVEPATDINRMPQNRYDHVHVDWRPGGAVWTSYCKVPPVPTNFKGEKQSRTDFKLSWSKVSTNPDFFIVERKRANGVFAEIGKVENSANRQIKTLSFEDKNLEEGTYKYRVRSVNELSGKSNHTSEIEFTVPPLAISENAIAKDQKMYSTEANQMGGEDEV